MKEVAVAPGGEGDGDGGARAQRFVVCHNPEQADRDAAVRQRLLAHLQALIAVAVPARGDLHFLDPQVIGDGAVAAGPRERGAASVLVWRSFSAWM